MSGTAIPHIAPAFSSWRAPGGGDHRSAEQLARGLGKPTREGKEWRCLCPAHDDKRHPSLSIRDSDNGKPLLICRSGCSQEQVIAALQKLGLWPKSPDSNNGTGNHKQNGHTDKKPDDVWEPMVPPPAGTLPPSPSQLGCDMLHEYRDADGNILLYVKRIEANGDRKKQFVPVTFGTRNGKLGWHEKHPHVPKPLYGLDRLACAAPDATVLLCEGEKSADAAMRLFPEHVATAWMGGTYAATGADLLPLKGRSVVIWPDADDKGREAGARIAKRLPDAITLDTTGLPDRYDAADLEAEGVPDALGWLKARLRGPQTHDEPPLEPPPPNDGEIDATLKRLAGLSILRYEQVRAAEAKCLNLRTSILDKLVAQTRPSDAQDNQQGRPLSLPVPEPWPEPVNGAELLTTLADFFAHHAFLPARASFALALWTAHTHAFELFKHSPRLHVRGIVKNSGKTTVLDLLEMVCCRPLPAANVTSSAMFRAIEMAKPTLLLDEADTFLNENEELRGIINAGHKQGGQVLRTVGDDHMPRMFSVFGPVAIAGIGDLPGTIADRAIRIAMKRALKDELPSPITNQSRALATELARKIVRWTIDHETQLASATPDMGDDLFNRRGDNWRPMIAIADVAGDSWPEIVRLTAKTTLVTDDDTEPLGVKLLADIRTVFDDDAFKDVVATKDNDSTITSVDLANSLVKLEGRPWAELGRAAKPITQNRLARMLAPFKIIPGYVGPASDRKRGYALSRFLDAFARHLPPQ
jgi:hypothetical protein